MPRRNQPEQQRRGERHAERERQHRQIEPQGNVRLERQIELGEADEPNGERRDEQAHPTADDAVQRALDEQLREQLSAACAERGTQRHLPAPRLGLRKHQVGHVRARHHEHQRHEHQREHPDRHQRAVEVRIEMHAARLAQHRAAREIAVRVVVRQSASQRTRLCFGLHSRGVRLQTPGDREEAIAAPVEQRAAVRETVGRALAHRLNLGELRDRHEDIRHQSAGKTDEILRQHADHIEHVAADANRATDRARRATELVAPETMTHDDDGRASGEVFVLEQSARSGPRLEQVEVAAGDDGTDL